MGHRRRLWIGSPTPRGRAPRAASLAAFCRIYGLLLGNIAGVPRRKLLTLELGERLCDTYETYRACFPPSELEIEELLSFILGIAENEVIALGRCTSCSGNCGWRSNPCGRV